MVKDPAWSESPTIAPPAMPIAPKRTALDPAADACLLTNVIDNRNRRGFRPARACKLAGRGLATLTGGPPPPLLSRTHAAYAECGVAVAPTEMLPVLVAGAVTVGPLVAATVGDGAVIGVKVTPVTSPLMAFLC